MSLIDRTNEEIHLMIPADVLRVDVDADLSIRPDSEEHARRWASTEHMLGRKCHVEKRTVLHAETPWVEVPDAD